MGLGWPIMLRPPEDGGDFGLLFPTRALCNNRLKRRIIAVNTWWEPKCDPKAFVGALCCPCFERARSEGSE